MLVCSGVASGAVLVSSVLWLGLGINRVSFSFLKDNYGPFVTCFLPALWVALICMLILVEWRRRLFPLLPLGSAAAGFLLGILATMLMPLLLPNGWQRFQQMPFGMDRWIGAALHSLLVLAWLFGGMLGVLALVLSPTVWRMIRASSFLELGG